MAGAKKALAALSPAVRKLAGLPILVVLGTKRDDGAVQLNPVWFEFEDGFFWLNSNTGRLWPKNLQRDRELTMLLVDPKTPDRYAQIKGRLVSLIPDPAAEFPLPRGFVQPCVAQGGLARPWPADVPRCGPTVAGQRRNPTGFASATRFVEHPTPEPTSGRRGFGTAGRWVGVENERHNDLGGRHGNPDRSARPEPA